MTRRPLVVRARSDPFFLGSALEEYATYHKLDDLGLASWLECSPEDLARLTLCRLPDANEIQLRERVDQIATFARCNVERLMIVIREIGSIEAIRGSGDAGLLMAARDRVDDAKLDDEVDG